VASALVVDHVSEDHVAESLGAFNRIAGWSFVGGLVVGTLWLRVLPAWWDTALTMRGLFVFAGSVASLSLVLALRFLREPVAINPHRQFRAAMTGRIALGVIERALYGYPRSRYFVLRPAFVRQAGQHLRGALGQYYLCSSLMFCAISLGYVPLPIFLTNVLGATNTQVFLVSLVKFTTDALLYVPMGRAVRQRRGLGLLSQAAAGRALILSSFGLLALLQPAHFGLVLAAGVHLFSGVT
jgi:hypothetical protein